MAYADSFKAQWDRFYRWAFHPRSVEVVTDLHRQLLGIDRVLSFDDMPSINVDEKTFSGTWNHLLVEVWSKHYGRGSSRNRRGWSVRDDMLTDLVLYAEPELTQCHVLPHAGLLAAIKEHGRGWIAADRSWPRKSTTTGGGYETWGFRVRWPDVLRTVKGSRRLTWPDEGSAP